MNDPHKRKRKRRPRGAPLEHAPEGVTYARERAGLTKRALAEGLGISEQLMCDIEAGRRNAAPDLQERMAAELHCPVVVLQAKSRTAPEMKQINPAPEPDHAKTTAA